MKGVWLLQLGSPDQPTPRSCRKFLREFLMDKKVIDLPWVFRAFFVHLLIAPFRPFRTARAYRSIWRTEGSPLRFYSESLERELKKDLGSGVFVRLGMRYGSGGLNETWQDFKTANVDEILLLPLYPQYAEASTGSALECARAIIDRESPTVKMRVLEDFYEDDLFLDAVVAQSSGFDLEAFDHILFSYHGLPLRQLRRLNNNCLKSADCCHKIGKENRKCYRAQCFASSRKLQEKLQLSDSKVTTCFQSRLGITSWIGPHTDKLTLQLAREGKKRIAVFCPSFVSDCLETLEEIEIRLKEAFLSEGGEELVLIPSANLHPIWVKGLATLIQKQI